MCRLLARSSASGFDYTTFEHQRGISLTAIKRHNLATMIIGELKIDVQNDWAALKDTIRRRLQSLNWSQGELARQSNVSRSTVSRLLGSGACTRVEPENLIALCDALEINVTSVFSSAQVEPITVYQDERGAMPHVADVVRQDSELSDSAKDVLIKFMETLYEAWKTK